MVVYFYCLYLYTNKIRTNPAAGWDSQSWRLIARQMRGAQTFQLGIMCTFNVHSCYRSHPNY